MVTDASPPPLAIALLTYSTSPRGGVAHALAVGEQLARRGHDVEVVAIAAPGTRFYRDAAVATRIVPYLGPDRPIEAKILTMIAAYAHGLEPSVGRFDVVHAQDCLSASALAALGGRVALPPFLRTVHHLDDFSSPALVECQERSVLAPDRLLVVSEEWRERLRREHGRDAEVVGNGVDAHRFAPLDARARSRARERLGWGERPVVLTVGGIEPRKGSIRLLEAIAALRAGAEPPLLAIAGGETLFDYRGYRDRFFARLHELGLALDDDVRLLGRVDDAAMPALYGAADVFAFPSTKEGFGLAVLEALACALPAVVSDLPVFGEFLVDGESALFTAGDGPAELTAALQRGLHDVELRRRLRTGGASVVRRFTWAASAANHERIYRRAVAEGRRARAAAGA